MKKSTLLLKSLLLSVVLFCATSLSALAAEVPIFSEDFTGLAGNNTTTGGSSATWSGNSNFSALVNAYQAGDAVKLGASSKNGSIKTIPLDLSVNGGSFTVSFSVKGWTAVEGDITVTVDGLPAQTANYTAKMADDFETVKLSFTGGKVNSGITFATTMKRAFLDNIKVYYEAIVTEDPALIAPATIAFEKAQILAPVVKSVTLQGANLTGDLNVALTGTAFSTTIENNTIAKDAVQAEGGYTFDLTFNPIAVAPYAETITISGGGLATPVVIDLTGEGVNFIAATLAELRSMEADNATEYTFSGTAIITLASKDRNVKYIQDGTGAIIIDDASGLIKGSYATGDEISAIKGKLQLYNGMLQFVVTADATKGASVAVTPIEIKIDNVTIDDQAKLVKIKSIQLEGEGLLFAKGTNVSIEGSSIVVRPQYSDLLDLIGSPIPTVKLQDVTGVILVFNNAIQIVPRSIADIVDSELVGLTDQSADGVTIYANNGVIYVNATAGQTIDIFNTVGQKLNSVVAVEGLNSIDNNSTGIVIVKVGATAVKVQM